MAAVYYPLSKEQAMDEGFQWNESDELYKDLEAVDPPEMLSDLDSDITKNALKSIKSGKRYNVTKPEIDFHKNYNIPLPGIAPMERLESFAEKNVRKLWDRNCTKCNNAIQTTYSQERPEKVFCEQCYLQEVY